MPIDITFFSDEVKKGKEGEAAASSFLSAMGYSVEDVSDNPDYFKSDIDLIAAKGDEVMTIEVKSDYRISQTGNLCVEIWNDITRNSKGWLFYTQATNIFFVDVRQAVIHAVRTEELRQLYRKNHFSHYDRDQLENDEYYKRAQLCLIPLAAAQTLEHYNYIDLKKEYLR